MGHNVCSLGRRMTCWLDEAVKVNAVCDISSSVDEGIHEGLEVELLGVGNLESRQLVFSDILAVDSDQRQSNHIQKKNQVRINPARFRTANRSTRRQARKILTITKSLGIPRQIKSRHQVSHSAGGGLAGSTKASKSIPSTMRVAVSMNVSMEDWN